MESGEDLVEKLVETRAKGARQAKEARQSRPIAQIRTLPVRSQHQRVDHLLAA